MKLTPLVLSLTTTTALAGSTWCNRGQYYCGWLLNQSANPPSTVALLAGKIFTVVGELYISAANLL